MTETHYPLQNNQWGERISLVTTGTDLTIQKTTAGRTPIVTPIGVIDQAGAEQLRDFLNTNYPA